jgi:A/G-specific adenine glycosylase
LRRRAAPPGMLRRVPGSATVPPGFREAVLAWFGARGRSLPFRAARDPYAILVSEAMAQQTQVERAAAAWTSFVARFPTVEALAAAAPGEVLLAWRGLGYNRRALNLWRAARVIVEEHGGRVPSDLAGLERLPGVGPYTARAVAAIAFGRPVGAVDTNVRRVLGRAILGAGEGIGPARMQALADEAVPPDRPADWTHALMDVGATFCRPRNPVCAPCPVRPWCRYASGSHATDDRPVPRDREEVVAFPATGRWLRGRILDRLRDAGMDGWASFREAIGLHDEAAVAAALAALAREGLADLHPDDPRLARLPRG